ncbi:DUF2087 domain-containing protein [Secundilactobacillus kimchicus]|uniref:DUF2087 domain-containing protein n=1 Tax=Secundilactobacillus kimchicus JCM 15530 TaxID=1302272 RepID=A0A0R1HPQ5_9LACO|nr:DUF2087 domain-containing protein [Secundilactobacillus kimchicus]KRK48846.1 hypothetical protein FC96_GL001167 [Secundilactobacillus kimchicus JCM 15530]MBT9671944.1 DUF2087 domain-containing protein [Secundilactobacillus kimchicus]
MFDLTQLNEVELISGYHNIGNLLMCNYCQLTMARDQVSEMVTHIMVSHGGPKEALLKVTSKYNSLTATQEQILRAFLTANKDQEVADRLNLKSATIRHQKFTFREKAKAARLYIAQYQAVFGDTPVKATQYLPVPASITQPDDRFKLTEGAYADLVTRYFAPNQARLTLKQWPKGEKKRFGLMIRISQEFEMNRRYSLRETDNILRSIYSDYSLLKRYLIDDGFFDRTPDGREYWRIF